MLRLLFAALIFAPSVPAMAQQQMGPAEIVAIPDDLIAESEARWVAEAKAKRQRENRAKVIPGLVAVTALDIADIVTAHRCVRSVYCHEGNGIYGRKPSLGTILAIKGAEIVGTWLIALNAGERSPLAANVFLGARGIITGKAVIGNIRILW